MWQGILLVLHQARTFLARPVEYSWKLAVIQGVSLLIALFFFQYPIFPWLLPGYAVAALGLVAVVMTIRAEEEWSRTERIMWLFLATILMVVEMRIIKKDRDQSDSIQNAVVKRNQGQFDATISKLQTHTTKLEELSQSEEKLQRLTKRNLENITGGDSYAYITPQMGVTPIPLTIYNYGTNTLTGVMVEILPPTQSLENLTNAIFNPVEIQIGTLHPGTFGTTGPRVLKGYFIDPRAITTTVIYQARIYSQNFTVTQDLFFKPGTHHLLYKTTVQRQYVKRKVGDTIYYGYKTLSQTDWTKDD